MYKEECQSLNLCRVPSSVEQQVHASAVDFVGLSLSSIPNDDLNGVYIKVVTLVLACCDSSEPRPFTFSDSVGMPVRP